MRDPYKPPRNLTIERNSGTFQTVLKIVVLTFPPPLVFFDVIENDNDGFHKSLDLNFYCLNDCHQYDEFLLQGAAAFPILFQR